MTGILSTGSLPPELSLLDHECESVRTCRHLLALYHSRMRKFDHRILVGAGPPGRRISGAESLYVPAVRH